MTGWLLLGCTFVPADNPSVVSSTRDSELVAAADDDDDVGTASLVVFHTATSSL